MQISAKQDPFWCCNIQYNDIQVNNISTLTLQITIKNVTFNQNDTELKDHLQNDTKCRVSFFAFLPNVFVFIVMFNVVMQNFVIRSVVAPLSSKAKFKCEIKIERKKVKLDVFPTCNNQGWQVSFSVMTCARFHKYFTLVNYSCGETNCCYSS